MIIVDEVTLRPDDVAAFLMRWRDDYRPGAEARGLELVGVWTGGTSDPRRHTVLVQWRVPSMTAFWAARLGAAEDRTVLEFWAETDRVALNRDRKLLLPESAG